MLEDKVRQLFLLGFNLVKKKGGQQIIAISSFAIIEKSLQHLFMTWLTFTTYLCFFLAVLCPIF
jgi:hypothetical protein